MSLSRIARVLSSIRKHNVRALLMGGQACIVYGAAEFSRDVDLAVLADARNLDRLRQALADLQAQPIFVPALTLKALERGHACHFLTGASDMDEMRIDIMTKMHGCEPFPQLWKRRQRVQVDGVGVVAVLSLADLVQAKKTQRDKDWPMIRRLVEVNYYDRPKRPSPRLIDFWLREGRTAEILIALASKYPRRLQEKLKDRPLLTLAAAGDEPALAAALREEEDKFRQADRQYWRPLREELFMMRQAQRRRLTESNHGS